MRIAQLSKRHRKQICRLEEEVYPVDFQLGEEDLFEDVEESLSCVVVDEHGKIHAYMLAEVDDNSVYVADIVRMNTSTISATEMLMWALGRLVERPDIEIATAECRSTSVHLIERLGLEVLHKVESWCDWRQEFMTEIAVKLPDRS